jgi:oligosaccharide repeat unit polymerase
MSLADIGWGLLFGVVGALGVGTGRHLFGYWLSPLGVFCGMTCGSMVAYHMRLLEMTDASFAVHAILLAALGCFTVGCLIGLEGVPRARLDGRPPRCDAAGLDVFFLVTACLATLGWVVAVLILIGRHGLGALLGSIWVLQHEFQMQFIGYLNMIGILVLPTFVLKVGCGRFRKLDVLFVVGALFGLLLAGIKAYIVYSMLTAMLVWAAVGPHRFRPWHLAAGLLMLLAFFVVYTSVIDIFVVDRLESRTWFAGFPALHQPYLYLVGSWPALENVVNGTAPPSPPGGLVVLQPLWKLLGDGLGIIEPRPFNLPFTTVGTTFFNVYSLPGEVYWDFGWPGLVIVTTLLGFVTTRLYVRLRTRGYWGHFLVYGIAAHGLFLAPFVYVYRFNVLVMLVYVFGLGFVVLRRGVLLAGRDDG